MKADIEIETHKAEHRDPARVRQAVLDFYSEHQHFLMPVLHCGQEGVLTIVLDFPTCYSYHCSYKYSLRELADVVEQLRCASLLLADVKLLLDYTQKFPERIARPATWVLKQYTSSLDPVEDMLAGYEQVTFGEHWSIKG